MVDVEGSDDREDFPSSIVCVRGAGHKIVLKPGAKGCRQNPLRTNPGVEDVVREQVLKQMKDGLVDEASPYDTDWVSPAFAVPSNVGG